MKKAVAYVRMSQDVEGKGWGVDTQRRKIKHLADARGWELSKEYEDNYVSASKERGSDTDWHAMVEAAKRGEFDVVISVDLDRLLRSTKDLVTLIDTGVGVVTVDGELDLSTADGEFRATMLAGIARFEVRRKAERSLRSNERRRAEGMPLKTGKQPFGYEKDGLTKIPAEAKVVAKLFNDFLSGVSIRQLTRDLNAGGWTTARDGQWSTDAVRYMLSNGRYAGFIEYHATGELFPGGDALETVVSVDTWKATRAKLADNVSKTTKRGNQPKYLLSGIARCGKCGAKMVSGQNERKIPNYKCSAQFNVSRQREPVDAMVNAAAIARLSAPDARELFTPPEVPGVDREALRAERTTWNARQDGLTTLLSDPNIPLSQVKEASAHIQQRLREIDSLLAVPTNSPGLEIVEAGELGETSEERFERVEEVWWGLDMDRRRMIVDAIMTVTIEPAVKGNWKFTPELIRIEPKEHAG